MEKLITYFKFGSFVSQLFGDVVHLLEIQSYAVESSDNVIEVHKGDRVGGFGKLLGHYFTAGVQYGVEGSLELLVVDLEKRFHLPLGGTQVELEILETGLGGLR